jgi:lipopolysaccharide transport system permease protein
MTSIASSAKTRPVLRIRAGSGWSLLDLQEMWSFRDLLWTLTGRDIKLRYRQTALGAAWVVLQPLLGASIFGFVFGRLAGMPAEGVAHFVFSFAGLMYWHVFSQVLNRTSSSLVGHSHLVTKVYFPRMLLPLGTAMSSLVDLGISSVVLMVLLGAYDIAIGWQFLLLPVWVLLVLMLALGLGFVASALTVHYRDVQHMIPVLINFMLFASPVGYSLESVRTKAPESLQTVYMLNPLATLLEAFRWSVLGRGEFSAGGLAYAAAVCLSVFVLGALIFKRMEVRFADVI